jgi:predicted DNA-binding transcriptional regulator
MNNYNDLFTKSNTLTELKKNKLIEDYINRGFSIIPVNDNKLPLIKWKQYQNKQPEPYEIYNWYFDFPNFNTGIITGFGGFYSVDFDNLEAFKNFPDEYKNTALTETKRGIHLNFYSKGNYAGTILKVNDFKVEFKGTSQYVIEPPSIIGDFEYRAINPLSMIKDLPHFITDLLEKEKEKEIPIPELQINWQFKGTQACIKQILNRELMEGERERSLFALYNLLLKSNDIKYSQYLVVKKNRLLKQPLPEKEVLNIFKQKAYNSIGCAYIKGNLPYISCEGCKWQKEAIEGMDFSKVIENKKLTDRDIRVFYKLVIQKANKETIAKQLEIKRLQVYRSIDKLKKEGFL